MHFLSFSYNVRTVRIVAKKERKFAKMIFSTKQSCFFKVCGCTATQSVGTGLPHQIFITRVVWCFYYCTASAGYLRLYPSSRSLVIQASLSSLGRHVARSENLRGQVSSSPWQSYSYCSLIPILSKIVTTSLPHHCSIVAPSLPHRRPIVATTVPYRRPIVVPTSPHRRLIVPPSSAHCWTIIPNHPIVASLSPHRRHIVALSSPPLPPFFRHACLVSDDRNLKHKRKQLKTILENKFL